MPSSRSETCKAFSLRSKKTNNNAKLGINKLGKISRANKARHYLQLDKDHRLGGAKPPGKVV